MEQNLRITDYFGCYVFGDDAMQKYMDATTYAEQIGRASCRERV